MRAWHIVTGEFPPDTGGVAAYTMNVAQALAAAGDTVHVWTSGHGGATFSADTGVVVHRVFGAFGHAEIAAAGARLDASARGGRVLLQWVPHAFGGRATNLQVAAWFFNRAARRGEDMDIMVHEPFLPFAGSVRQSAAALVQRAMTALVVRSAARVFVGTPAWAAMCRPLAWRKDFRWLPIPSGVPVSYDAEDRDACRRALRVPEARQVIGCFGRGGEAQHVALEALGRELLARRQHALLLLVGAGSEALAARVRASTPALARLVCATGVLPVRGLSRALRACDVMMQPYADGVCTRHSSVAALLAHSLPVVTASGRFTESLWRTSRAVRLVPTNGMGTLSQSVLDLLEDEDERRRLGAAASALYRTSFDVRHTVTALQGWQL